MAKQASSAGGSSRSKAPGNDRSTSTTYAAARYAHPFFLPAAHADRQPINGLVRMTDWSKKQLGPIPPVARGGRMDLAEIIGADGVKEIEDLGEIRFHALGDSGVGMAQEAEKVAGEMAGAILFGDRLACEHALARHELQHLVDQQHRIAMRQHRLDGQNARLNTFPT